jgi:hypothetical protein
MAGKVGLRSVRRAIPLLPLLLVLAAGCGDDDDSTETATAGATATAEPLTKAEYIAQADAICEEFGAKTGPLAKELNRALNDSDFARAARAEREAHEAVRDGYEQINELPPPEGDENATSAIAEARNRFLVLDQRFIDAIEAEDFTRIEAVNAELRSTVQKRNALLTAYGFQVCGQGD